MRTVRARRRRLRLPRRRRPRPAPAPDPIQALIDESQKHYLSGQRELEVGHLDRARVEFDRAIDVLLTAPGGARTEPRLREQFDRLVDRISALEVATLAEGDGFSEKPSEPASIDALFDLAPAVEESPTAALTATVETDLALTSHDIPIPLNARVLSYVELFQGRLRGFIQEGLDRGSDYLPMIQSVFRAEGLPLDLAYVPLIESAFKTNALSRARANGVWQFMRPTAHRKRPEARLVCRRAVRSPQGHAGRGEVPQDAAAGCSTATGTWRWPRTTAGRAGCSGR